MFAEFVHQLGKLDNLQGLTETAVQTCKSWMKKEPSPQDNVEIRFHSQALIFRHHLLDYPFIKTRLLLVHGEQETGYYELITRLNGDIEDDYFVLYPSDSME